MRGDFCNKADVVRIWPCKGWSEGYLSSSSEVVAGVWGCEWLLECCGFTCQQLDVGGKVHLESAVVGLLSTWEEW